MSIKNLQKYYCQTTDFLQTQCLRRHGGEEERHRHRGFLKI